MFRNFVAVSILGSAFSMVLNAEEAGLRHSVSRDRIFNAQEQDQYGGRTIDSTESGRRSFVYDTKGKTYVLANVILDEKGGGLLGLDRKKVWSVLEVVKGADGLTHYMTISADEFGSMMGALEEDRKTSSDADTFYRSMRRWDALNYNADGVKKIEEVSNKQVIDGGSVAISTQKVQVVDRDRISNFAMDNFQFSKAPSVRFELNGVTYAVADVQTNDTWGLFNSRDSKLAVVKQVQSGSAKEYQLVTAEEHAGLMSALQGTANAQSERFLSVLKERKLTKFDANVYAKLASESTVQKELALGNTAVALHPFEETPSQTQLSDTPPAGDVAQPAPLPAPDATPTVTSTTCVGSDCPAAAAQAPAEAPPMEDGIPMLDPSARRGKVCPPKSMTIKDTKDMLQAAAERYYLSAKAVGEAVVKGAKTHLSERDQEAKALVERLVLHSDNGTKKIDEPILSVIRNRSEKDVGYWNSVSKELLAHAKEGPDEVLYLNAYGEIAKSRGLKISENDTDRLSELAKSLKSGPGLLALKEVYDAAAKRAKPNAIDAAQFRKNFSSAVDQALMVSKSAADVKDLTALYVSTSRSPAKIAPSPVGIRIAAARRMKEEAELAEALSNRLTQVIQLHQHEEKSEVALAAWNELAHLGSSDQFTPDSQKRFLSALSTGELRIPKGVDFVAQEKAVNAMIEKRAEIASFDNYLLDLMSSKRGLTDSERHELQRKIISHLGERSDEFEASQASLNAVISRQTRVTAGQERPYYSGAEIDARRSLDRVAVVGAVQTLKEPKASREKILTALDSVISQGVKAAEAEESIMDLISRYPKDKEITKKAGQAIAAIQQSSPSQAVAPKNTPSRVAINPDPTLRPLD